VRARGSRREAQPSGAARPDAARSRARAPARVRGPRGNVRELAAQPRRRRDDDPPSCLRVRTRAPQPRTPIEIGRWRGGSTIALAAGMGPDGKVWSIDSGEKAARVLGVDPLELDAQTRSFAARFDLDVALLRGDSRTIDLDVEDVDIVLIDGDHSYEGVRSDFERWGRRVRPGGAVLARRCVPRRARALPPRQRGTPGAGDSRQGSVSAGAPRRPTRAPGAGRLEPLTQ
jgi:predicted O-methyltransferase YrrM